MTSPPDLGVNRLSRAWIFYAGAAIAVIVAGLCAWAGLWPSAAVALVLGVWVACHPWIRGEWYRLGWWDGRNGTDSTRNRS